MLMPRSRCLGLLAALFFASAGVSPQRARKAGYKWADHLEVLNVASSSADAGEVLRLPRGRDGGARTVPVVKDTTRLLDDDDTDKATDIAECEDTFCYLYAKSTWPAFGLVKADDLRME